MLLSISTQIISFVEVLIFSSVLFGVGTCVYYLKIFKSIIKGIVVDVMNMLVSFKFAPKMLFHDKPMLELVFLIANMNAHIFAKLRFTTFPLWVITASNFTFAPSRWAIAWLAFKNKLVYTRARTKLFTPTLVVFFAVLAVSFIESHVLIVHRIVPRVKPLNMIGT